MNLLDLGYVVLAGLTAPVWARKARGDWGARFGKATPIEGSGRRRIMLHAVSVGEVNAIRELVPMLLLTADVIVSTTTDTGMRRARDVFGAIDRCHVVRYPLDFSWSVRRFLDAARPDAVGLVELEVWPNFVKACVARGVPVAVLNGRLSEKSFKGYGRFRWLVGPSFRRLSVAAVQDGAYAERFEAMGTPLELVRVVGSMKWDTARVDEPAQGGDALAAAMGIDPERPLIVAGSTGPIDPAAGDDGCEELLLHRACPAGVQLLCAPRKPERFEEALDALGGAERCVTRSSQRQGAAGTDRFLLDTIGELRDAYSLADVAIVGRTFGTLHGSDPIEPAALGKPVVVGPDMQNFESIARTLTQAGALVEASASNVGEVLAELLADPTRRQAIGERGRACVRAEQGATARCAEAMLDLVDTSPKGDGA